MATHGYDKDDYLKRLRRIEGQIRGLQRMVDNDDYCIDILTQVSGHQGVAERRRRAARRAPAPLRGRPAAAGDPGEADRLIGEATNAIDRLVKS